MKNIFYLRNIKKTRAISLLIILASLLSQKSWANDPPELLFGPEFTFSSIKDNWKKEEALMDYLNYLEKKLIEEAPEGRKFSHPPGGPKRIFISPDGWSFNVTTDLGVIEVKMPPMTAEDYMKYESDIQKAIFDSAYNVGMIPLLFLGGGHISIGLDYFKNDLLLLRNFIVDFINHNELSMGILNYDTNNALPLWLFPEHQIQKTQQFLNTIDPLIANNQLAPSLIVLPHEERELNIPIQHMDPTEKRMYVRLLYPLKAALTNGPRDAFCKPWDTEMRGKRVAINLKIESNHHLHEKRIEIRSIRPQYNMRDFILLITLLKKRIEYLKNISKPIPLKINVPLLKSTTYSPRKYLLRPPIPPQKALAAFYQYLKETGLQWENYRHFVWPKWQFNGQLEKFEKELERKKRKLRRLKSNCSKFLKPKTRFIKRS
ncbi:MAG: hypothetical protein D6797_00640 [Bdellovibrio sp.]|nr:MAG: hypothetical protein D6797_00640 [Bdellovibrio sp.]